MRIRTRTALAALPLVLAAALTGCRSDGDDHKGVDSVTAGGTSGASGTGKSGQAGSKSAEPSTSPQEAALRFVRCMRENGVPMEDPVDGRLTITQKAGSGTRAMDKAMRACQRYKPRGTGPEGTPDPKTAEATRKGAGRGAPENR
ncbi:hypothetical protein [Streptomyces katsurahamanus]|uniref:Lipoprotein n=1 Tax=Streptomyces katsurahamanus TaxID=2577098 RepID=A0ABW9NUP9_9ACTN|nr:hypothetical protein [Streptomyces katsurahamanus]MQS36609.1 hypothetical protein [Streptomyces katsurahamanus]